MHPTCLLVVAVLLSPSAWAYVLKRDSTGENVRWSRPAAFVVDAELPLRLGDDQALLAVERAVETVRAAAPGLSLTVEPGETTGVGYDFSSGAVNRSEIVAPEEWNYDEGSIAVTVVSIDVTRHVIVDADIAFNREHRRFKVLPETSRAGGAWDDIQNTLTHELGHAVGLAHNPELPDAVMYPGARAGEIKKRVLSEDDRAGLLFLYAQELSSLGAAVDEGDVQVGCSASGGRGAASLVALLLPFAAVTLARRRQRSGPGAAVTLVVLLAAPLTARAAEEVRAPAPAREASVVATAQVLSRRTLPPNDGQRVLQTELVLALRHCAKGRCPETLTVRVPGGRHGDIEQIVEGLTVPEPGEVIGLTRAGEGARSNGTRVYRLAHARDFIAFARGLAAADLRVELPLPGSDPTSWSGPTR